MTAQTESKQQRQAAIAELLEDCEVSSQRELADLLAERGIEVNQATLSRDMRQLGVVKDGHGYHLPSEGPFTAGGPTELIRAVREWLVGAVAASNQVVLRTPPSGAQPLALAIDRAELDGVLGTVAGDDTVLVITSGKTRANGLVRKLDRIGKGKRA
ncbi:MAG: arginine repressor [Planctomycetota bacterium]|jgi:transcriptional regulator of arginine metabolism